MMKTMMNWLLPGLMVVNIIPMTLGQSTKMEQVCLTPGGNSIMTYTCESHQMIHVISKLYQEASETCVAIDDACQVLEDDQTNGYTTDCNGKTECTDDLSNFRINKTCVNITNALATVSYECVNGQPIDVCNNITASSGVDNILHLKSPNFPTASFRIDTCDCDITGTDISVQILEMRVAFDVRMQDNIPELIAKANLTLIGDTASWMSYPFVLFYNTEVIDRTSNLSVMFEANGSTGHLLWIRLNGTSTLNIKCNDGLPTTESHPTVSPNTMTSVTKSSTEGMPSSVNSSVLASSTVANVGTDKHTTKKDDAVTSDTQFYLHDQNTTGIVVGSVFAVLVVAAVAIVIICLLIRRKRHNKYMTSRENLQGGSQGYEDTHMEDIHAYEKTLAAIDASDSMPRDNDHEPSSPIYFELEKLGSAMTSVEQENKHESGRTISDAASTTSKSNVPYTSQRLEELYAKVIPKKFRSTKAIREGEERTSANGTNGGRKSDTSANGTTNDAYDHINIKQNGKHKSKNKNRTSRSKSDLDYQEICGATTLKDDSSMSPSVPPKAERMYDAEVIEKEEKRDQESNKASKDVRSKKHRKTKSSTTDPKPNTGPHLQSEPQLSPDAVLDQKRKEMPERESTDDERIMVDNILYEGSNPVLVNRNGVVDNDQGRGTSSPETQGPEYEDIKEVKSSRPHFGGDKRPGRPSAYEEIII